MSKATILMAPEKLPRLSRIEFFRNRDVALASSLAKANADHLAQFPDAKLSSSQIAISVWASAAVDVPNGGFTQFFYNHGGDHGVRELADQLDTLELNKAATILREASAIYGQHRQQFCVRNPWDGLFGSIEAFERLEKSFMKVILRCSRALDSWILSHIDELATDDAGQPIDSHFTGTVESHHPNGQVKESLEVKNGRPHGLYRKYFDDGSIRDSKFYKAGKISGDFWPNGQLKRKESRKGKQRIIEWYYPSGALQKRYVMDKDGYASEPIRRFHENGQLAEEVTTVHGKRSGPWRRFFEDGSPELEATHVDDEKLIVHNAWNEKRQQIVKSGMGVFRDYPAKIDWKYDVFFENGWPRESELKEGIPHGKVITYRDGVVWSIARFADGTPDGEWTTYWNNGRIRSVVEYSQGTPGASQQFPKFDLRNLR